MKVSEGLHLSIVTHTSSAGTATTTTTASATATSRSSATRSLSAGTLSVGALGLLTSGLGLASELDGNLALKDLLSGELLDGTLGLSRGGEVDKGVADRAVGARVLWDRDRLTTKMSINAWRSP